MTDKKYRLLQRCEVDGVWHEPGACVVKPADWVGPHKTVVASQHGADLTGPMHHDRRHAPANIVNFMGDKEQKLVDVPLYEEVVEEKPKAEVKVVKPADWDVKFGE